MKVIKLFEEFNSEIDILCLEYGVVNYKINPDGSIDVNGNVDLSKEGLTKLPLKFNKVNGDFNINANNLTSLEGSPRVVGGLFYCQRNKLTSLEGCPEKVANGFYCDWNQLTTLEGGPKEVGHFHCISNQITSFEGLPEKYVRIFECYGNPIYQLWKLFKDYKHIELFNDLDIVRDNNVIILQRLNEFLDMIGKPKVTIVKGYTCI